MNLYDNLSVLDISDEEISSEVVAAKEMAVEFGLKTSDIIYMRTALELDRLRETLINICIVTHRNSDLPNIARALRTIAER